VKAVSPGDDLPQAQRTTDPDTLAREVDQLNLASRCVEATEIAKVALAAKALNNLATLYFVQGRDADAEPLFKCALAILQKALGPNLADIATTRNYLARLPD
jgi:hypothetical protein